jgi:hypothetical protein
MPTLRLFSRSSRGFLARTRIESRHIQLMARALSVFLACALLGCHGDRRESFYPALADAKRDGAIDRGWIPDFLPESSRGIHELHDISPSTTWCAFQFIPSDSSVLRKSLQVDAGALSLVRRVPDPGRSWWPTALTGDIDAARIHSAGFELYALVEPETTSTKQALLFAIDWAKGRGFFYRTPVS